MKYLLILLTYLLPLTVEAPKVKEIDSPPLDLVTSQIQLLQGEVGTKEERGNRGSEIRKYQEETGAIHLPWCTSFLAYTYNKNANLFGLGTILPKKASSQALYLWAKKNGYLTESPEVGDIIIWRKGSSNRGHAGAIIEVAGDSIYTIEGNTKAKGFRREGVYEKKHHIRGYNGNMHVRGYIDISKVWSYTIRSYYVFNYRGNLVAFCRDYIIPLPWCEAIYQI